MTTSPEDNDLIDEYLADRLDEKRRAVFLSQLRSDSALRLNVTAQARVRSLVRLHYVLRLKQRAKELHREVANDPARLPLLEAIHSLFKP